MPKTINSAIETVSLSLLKPHPKNVNQGDFGAIQQSIETNGFYGTIVANKRTGYILAGNHRYHVAKQSGFDSLPVAWVDVDDEEEIRILLADNRTTRLGQDDESKLAKLLAELANTEKGLTGTGFDGDDLDRLISDLAGLPEAGNGGDEFDATPGEGETRCKPGDLWRIGDHRLLCGDSTNVNDVARLLDGAKPHLMVTDPPYGVEYDPSWRAEAGVNKNKGKMGKVLNDDRADWREAWALFPGDVAYVWHASLFTREVLDSLESCGFEHRSMIIWAKDRFTLGRGHYHWQHEPCWYVVRNGGTGHWNGDRKQSTVWNINAREDSGVGHGTQKPIECMRRPIENNSEPGNSVYEPFSGSGTTLIAAQRTGRKCYGLELSPAYCDVILKRAEVEGISPIELIEEAKVDA